jgi:hypothetical protein
MKTFPRFTEAQITVDLKQPYFKMVFASMQSFLNRFDTEMTPDEFKSLLDDIEKRQGIRFTPELTQNQAAFKNELEDANWALHEAYSEIRMQHADKVLTELNSHFDEHFDRDIFDLAEGETLKIADTGSVYG